MKERKKAEEIAAQRLQLLSPLLAEGLDQAKAKQIKEEICARSGLSEQTLRQYLARYRAEGLEGLKTQEKRESA